MATQAMVFTVALVGDARGREECLRVDLGPAGKRLPFNIRPGVRVSYLHNSLSYGPKTAIPEWLESRLELLHVMPADVYVDGIGVRVGPRQFSIVMKQGEVL